MTITLAYDTQLSRVRVSAIALDPGAVTVKIERSTNQIRWTTVRGGGALVVSGGAAHVDDYEFSPDVANWYRVTAADDDGDPVGQESSSVTPVLTSVWLKSVVRPFLNRRVGIRDWSEVERPSRSGVFDILGRSYPVAVTDVRTSRRWTVDLVTESPDEAEVIDLILASGDVLLVQVPVTGPASQMPGGYVAVDTSTSWPLAAHLPIGTVRLPCVEVAPPGPDVVGATVTWQTVLSTYAAWAPDVIAAQPTWADLLTLIGSPEDVIVP